jgi:PAS domain-containing protein
MYALALFRFHVFELIPVARQTVIEQTQEGMLVLDPVQKIVDLNPSAETILGLPAGRMRRRSCRAIVPALPQSNHGQLGPH